MAKFKLEIETGNDAMCTASDLSEALQRVAKRIKEADYDVVDLDSSISRGVLDLNGNTVGFWNIIPD